MTSPAIEPMTRCPVDAGVMPDVEIARSFPAPGARAAAVRRASDGNLAAGGPQRQVANEPWRRLRLARAYRACDERRRPRRACTLGTSWERFVD